MNDNKENLFLELPIIPLKGYCSISENGASL